MERKEGISDGRWNLDIFLVRDVEYKFLSFFKDKDGGELVMETWVIIGVFVEWS